MRAFVDERDSFDEIFLSVDRPFRYRPYRDKENASYDDWNQYLTGRLAARLQPSMNDISGENRGEH